MFHDQEGLSDLTMTGNTDASPERDGNPRSVWHCPSATIIDIKRTMFLAGSVTDFSSGSI